MRKQPLALQSQPVQGFPYTLCMHFFSRSHREGKNVCLFVLTARKEALWRNYSLDTGTVCVPLGHSPWILCHMCQHRWVGPNPTSCVESHSAICHLCSTLEACNLRVPWAPHLCDWWFRWLEPGRGGSLHLEASLGVLSLHLSDSAAKNTFLLQDGEHMYTHGWFMSMYGRNHYNIVK